MRRELTIALCSALAASVLTTAIFTGIGNAHAQASTHDSRNTETIHSATLPKPVPINGKEILVEHDARWEKVAGCA